VTLLLQGHGFNRKTSTWNLELIAGLDVSEVQRESRPEARNDPAGATRAAHISSLEQRQTHPEQVRR
jgi:hypothetical protein